MNCQYLLIASCLLINVTLVAQTASDIITKNFKFKDGIYATLDAFQRNQPTYIWEDVKANIATNPQTFITQVEYITYQNQLLDIDKVWGLCLGGIPYVQQPKELLGKQISVFVGLQMRGKISYFAYKTKEKIELAMPVYNPATGRPFRQQVIEREYQKNHAKMLNIETGEVDDFTITNFLKWIADDPELTKTVKEMNPVEAEEKLFKCLLIYVDRNEVRVKI